MNQRRTKVFISYSHHDREWLQRLHVHLRPLVRDSTIDAWDDTMIAPGSKWQTEIRSALASAKVAILLVSANFLASDYINANELPPLLEAAEREGAIVLPVIISPSAFSRTPQLSQFQSVNDPQTSLIDLPIGKQEAVFDQVAQHVEVAVGRRELRARFDTVLEKLEDQQQTLAEQATQIENQQEIINQLVRYLLSASVLRHLCGIGLLNEYRYWHSAPMSREMYFLRDIGFIQPRPPHSGFLDFNEALNGENLASLTEPTPIGWSCIRLRKDEIPPDWMHEDRGPNLRVDQIRSLGL